MRFIATIAVIALSGAALCSQDFGSHATRTANTDFGKKKQVKNNNLQSNSNSLPSVSTQQPLEKSQIFQAATNSQQNDVTNYRIQRPSFYTLPKIGYSACGPPSSMPYSTPKPNSQQYSSMCMQGFRGSTSYNSRLNQLSNASVLLPLDIPKSLSTHLSPKSPLFPLTTPRPLRSAFRTGKQLARFGGNGISTDAPPIKSVSPPATFPPQAGGYSGGIEFRGYLPPKRPFPPFTTSGEIGVGAGMNVVTMGEGPGITETGTGIGLGTTGTGETTDDDLSHPPHIHSLDVVCSKTMMTINIEFNRAFDGIIYSKGYFMNPECTYVKQNSGSTRYSFTVNLDSCGTQFINDFEGAAGQAYLENVLVLQNEPGIQEVWDTIRRVRCLWEGNINKALTVTLSVDMLNQEIVTFSGDTATAKLDIQIGKGPFAPAADGLVKIGETMTLVVSVEGDPGFDLQVRDCLARDEASTNMLQLTDERGCILKPKLFGTFQKTKDTGNTGASIIAYAFFQAFKFPDVMDLFIECNVELCKINCEPCPETNQQIEPRRRRRSVTYALSSNNSTNSVLLSDPVRVRQRFKVIMLDDLTAASSQILDSMETVETMIKAKQICMSNSGFYTIFSLILSTLFIAIISAQVLYIKLQRIRRPKLDF